MQCVYSAIATADDDDDGDDDNNNDNNDDDDISKINETLINYSEQCDRGETKYEQAKKAGEKTIWTVDICGWDVDDGGLAFKIMHMLVIASIYL